MKIILRRLQQLEKRRSESVATNDTSDARERILERLRGMADRMRGDPNWAAVPVPMPTVEELKARLQEIVSRYELSS